jgi:cell division protein FtsB
MTAPDTSGAREGSRAPAANECPVAGQGKQRRKRTLVGRRVPRWLLPVVVAGLMAFLYARPISSYLETRDQLQERRAEVAALRAERARVTARLERATSLDELARAARRIGYVRPAEHLFIVKGTAAWSRRHAERAATDGD